MDTVMWIVHDEMKELDGKNLITIVA